MSEPSPLRVIPGREPERTVPTVPLPAEVAARVLRERAPAVAVPMADVVADLHFRLRRLDRENAQLRGRLAVLERLLSDEPMPAERRRALRERAFDK